MQLQINDRHGNNPIEVVAFDYSSEPGILAKMVTLRQFSGSLTFHHSMTTNQARSMADALLACCEELDRVPA